MFLAVICIGLSVAPPADASEDDPTLREIVAMLGHVRTAYRDATQPGPGSALAQSRLAQERRNETPAQQALARRLLEHAFRERPAVENDGLGRSRRNLEQLATDRDRVYEDPDGRGDRIDFQRISANAVIKAADRGLKAAVERGNGNSKSGPVLRRGRDQFSQERVEQLEGVVSAIDTFRASMSDRSGAFGGQNTPRSTLDATHTILRAIVKSIEKMPISSVTDGPWPTRIQPTLQSGPTDLFLTQDASARDLPYALDAVRISYNAQQAKIEQQQGGDTISPQIPRERALEGAVTVIDAFSRLTRERATNGQKPTGVLSANDFLNGQALEGYVVRNEVSYREVDLDAVNEYAALPRSSLVPDFGDASGQVEVRQDPTDMTNSPLDAGRGQYVGQATRSNPQEPALAAAETGTLYNPTTGQPVGSYAPLDPEAFAQLERNALQNTGSDADGSEPQDDLKAAALASRAAIARSMEETNERNLQAAIEASLRQKARAAADRDNASYDSEVYQQPEDRAGESSDARSLGDYDDDDDFMPDGPDPKGRQGE
ncbi:MAG: hypothetical protein AAFR79_13275 [Pseudomonadota bacterium]